MKFIYYFYDNNKTIHYVEAKSRFIALRELYHAYPNQKWIYLKRVMVKS